MRKPARIFGQTVALLLAFTTWILLVGRHHFLLGSGLNFGRWILFLLGIGCLFIFKKDRFSMINVCLILALSGIFLEWAWTKIHYQSLAHSNTKTEVSFMTYNLFFKNRHPNSSLQLIKKNDPDILVVQEVTPAWEQQLRSKLPTYKYQKTKALEGTHGIGIYSKYPITNLRYLYNTSRLPIAQCVQLTINNQPVELCNAHLSSPAIAVENPDRFLELYHRNYQQRKIQTHQILLEMEKSSAEKKILIGDFNTMKIEPLYHQFRYDFVDLFNKKGTGLRFNFPNSSGYKRPFLTLDYIFAQGSISPISAEVLKGGSSDHRGLIGRVLL